MAVGVGKISKERHDARLYEAERLSLERAPLPGSPRYKHLQGRILAGVMVALGDDDGAEFFRGFMKENPAKFVDLLKAFVPVSRQSESVQASFSSKPDAGAVAADLARRLGAPAGPAADAPAIDVDACPAPSTAPAPCRRDDSMSVLDEIYS